MLKSLLYFTAAAVLLTLKASATEVIHPNLAVEQNRICHVEESYMAGRKCRDGDIMLYLPVMEAGRSSIILSSLVCDFRYNIMHSPEALSCVFTTRRSSQWAEFDMAMPN